MYHWSMQKRPTQIGEKFGRLTVLELYKSLPGKQRTMLCRCECGVEKVVRHHHVATGVTVSCGCVKRKTQITTGERHGRLIVLDAVQVRSGGVLKTLCRCDCGSEKLIGSWDLAHGVIKSCGCLVVEQIRALSLKHGGEGTPLYVVWRSMIDRCTNPKNESYRSYGGRGISVSPEWRQDFSVFRAWANSNGYRGDLQIDRREVNGNYEDSNCRWVTAQVNGNNRRNNVRLEAFGETKTMKDWSRDERCAVSYATLKNRIRKGKWASAQAAIETRAHG